MNNDEKFFSEIADICPDVYDKAPAPAPKSSRIKLDDSINNILFKLSEGNPGAINVIMDSITHGTTIDPDGMCGMAFVLNLDEFGIYGAKIWRLFNDVCSENLNATMGLVRAVQGGLLREEELARAIENGRKHTLDIQSVLDQLKAKLPNFQIHA